MKRTPSLFFLLGVIGLSWARALPVSAEVRLPKIISDHMVLQQGRPVAIWGWSEPEEKVTVGLKGKTVSVLAGKDGTWRVELSAMGSGGPFELVVRGKNEIRVRDVLVGEVWFCSGQSNMTMRVGTCLDYEKESAAANYPDIRMFTAKVSPRETPQTDCAGSWVVCGPGTVGSFSGTAYFFGRGIYEELNVPVGLIHSSKGGTPAQAWTSPASLKANRSLRYLVAKWQKTRDEYKKTMAKYPNLLAAWEQQAKTASAEGKPVPPKPEPPSAPPEFKAPGVLFNGMVLPFVPYRIRGVLWYQGEANRAKWNAYESIFGQMIEDWRKAWGQGDFPFLFVQLPRWLARTNLPVDDGTGLAYVRDSQLRTVKLPNTGMAVTIDQGGPDVKDLHPRNKQIVGYRLARLALGQVYEKKTETTGPIYHGMAVEGSNIRIQFTHLGGGLMTPYKEPLKGFAISGKDKKWVWAEARIDENTVVVWSKEIPNPENVRYGWADNPEVNLFNGAGFPASPFRTDGP